MRASLGAKMLPNGVLDAFLSEVSAGGGSLSAWGVAWARVLPTVLLVPAFGLGLLPVALRLAFGFALALSVAPLVPPAALSPSTPWPAALLSEALRGLPVALAASVSLWAAMVAGGVTDHVTGARKTRTLPAGLTSGSPFSTLLFLAAAVSFLRLGGAERIAARLATPPPDTVGPLSKAVFDLASGIELGFGIAAPLLIVALVVDVATLIAARELRTLRPESTFAPLRSLVLLVATAALLDRMAEAIATRGLSTP